MCLSLLLSLNVTIILSKFILILREDMTVLIKHLIQKSHYENGFDLFNTVNMVVLFILSLLCSSLWLNVYISVLLQIPRHAWCHRLSDTAAAVWQCQKEAVEYRSANIAFVVLARDTQNTKYVTYIF